MMNDIDLAEIEAQLYSQIYHSNSFENIENEPIALPITREMRRPNRYFQDAPQFGNKYQKKNFSMADPNLKTGPKTKHQPVTGQQTYLKDYSKPQSNKASSKSNEDQFLAVPPILILSKRQMKKAKWIERHAAKISQQEQMKALKTPPKPVHKRFPSDTSLSEPQYDVITLSDSDENDDSVIIVPPQWPQLSIVDSDDEEKPKKDKNNAQNAESIPESSEPTPKVDDVIYVEPPPEEVINLDEDSLLLSLKPEKSPILDEISPKTALYQQHERKELLGTPDSASNDFMLTQSVPATQAKFDFGLHGSDFNDSAFAKPISHKNDTFCETESSSSTATDLNMLKTSVFSEIEFPKEDIFAEANLESFGNFITPIRKSKLIESTPNEQSAALLAINNDSDSDSESVRNRKKGRSLPDLCHMDALPKKTKKGPISSKFDLINQEEDDETPQKEAKRKKRKSGDVSIDSLGSSKKKSKARKKLDQLSRAEKEIIESVLNLRRVGEEESRKKLKNKKKKNVDKNETIVDEAVEASLNSEERQKSKRRKSELGIEAAESPKERKKKRSETLAVNEEDVSLNEPSLISETKRRKSDSNETDLIDPNELVRRKKRSESLPPNVELSDEIADRDKKRKKNDSGTLLEQAVDVNTLTPSTTENRLKQNIKQEVECVKDRKKRRSVSLPPCESNEQTDKVIEKPHEDEVASSNIDNIKSEVKETKVIDEAIEKETINEAEKIVETKDKDKINKIVTAQVIVHAEPEVPLSISTEKRVKQPEKETEAAKKTLQVKVEGELFEGLEVVDETFGEPEATIDLVESSDSDSDLSALAADQSNDIQLLNLDTSIASNSKTEIDTKQTDIAIEVDSESNQNNQTINNDIEITIDTIPTKPCLANNSVEELQSLMPNDPSRWIINETDYVITNERRGMRRCNRCKEVGHMAVRCPNRIEIKCRLCGNGGHFEPRCPNRICMQCGRRSNYTTTYCKHCFKLKNYNCGICFMNGHDENSCPDLWRRYYLTTTDGPPNAYTGFPVHASLWCSGCARAGHLEHKCRTSKNSYPPTDPYIKNFDDILNIRHIHNNPRIPVHHRLGPPVYQTPPPLLQIPPSNINFQPPLLSFVPPNMPPTLEQTPQAVLQPLMAVNLGANSANPGNSEGFFFEDSLPNFVSFDEPDTNQATNVSNNRQNINNLERNRGLLHSEINTENWRKKLETLFYSGVVKNIKACIAKDMKKLLGLRKCMRPIKRNIKDALNKFAKIPKSQYKVLNMLIFGIYGKFEGKMHMNRMQQFMDSKNNAHLPAKQREGLLKAYLYIFGKQPHIGVDYRLQFTRL